MGRSIKIASIISYSTLILGNLISIIYTPFMLKTLGTSEYGLFSLVNTAIAYMYLLDLGFSSAIIRYNSKYMAENNQEKIKNINGMFLVLYLCISVVSIVISIIIYKNLDAIFFKGLNLNELKHLKIMFIIASVNVACSLPLNIFNGIILANERFIFSKLITLIRTLLNPIMMVCVLLMGYKSVGMVTISTIFNILIGIINIVYCFKILKIRINIGYFDVCIFKEILGYSFFIFMGSIAYQIYWSTDQIILGMFVNSASIAIYSLGTQMNTYFISFSNVISNMFLPKLTKLVVLENSKSEIMKLLTKVSRIQFFIATFILSGFILIGKSFIKLWAGTEYESSYIIAVLIMIPQIFSIIQSLFATLLEAMNKHKIKSYIYLSVAIFNLILSVVLVEKVGIIGCAIATAIGMTINAILNNLYYKYSLNLDMSYYWKNILYLFIPLIICNVFGWILTKIITIDSYIMVGIFIILFTIIYLIVSWKLSFNEYEKNIFKSIILNFHRDRNNIIYSRKSISK